MFSINVIFLNVCIVYEDRRNVSCITNFVGHGFLALRYWILELLFIIEDMNLSLTQSMVTNLHKALNL